MQPAAKPIIQRKIFSTNLPSTQRSINMNFGTSLLIVYSSLLVTSGFQVKYITSITTFWKQYNTLVNYKKYVLHSSH